MTLDVYPVPASPDYYLEIAKGNVPGNSVVNKFGHNPLADAGTTGATPQDVWGGGDLYPFYIRTYYVYINCFCWIEWI